MSPPPMVGGGPGLSSGAHTHACMGCWMLARMRVLVRGSGDCVVQSRFRGVRVGGSGVGSGCGLRAWRLGVRYAWGRVRMLGF